MPRPPILPTLDWQSIHKSGSSYDTWLASAEDAEKRRAIEEGLGAVRLEAHEAAALRGLARPVRVVAIAEDWCGDVVRHVPVLRLFEVVSEGRLDVSYILRELHADMFARFLTNGGEAIPKFVFLSETFVECGHWGPMPADGRRLIARGKACGDVPAARRLVSALYQADPDRREVVRELFDLVAIAAAERP